jgi:general secretion pathway protein I
MRSRARGFTLLEVMVALVVIAVALAAVMKSASSHARNAAFLETKTYAHWVAMNRLARLRMGGFGSLQDSDGTETMAGHEWYWRIKLTQVGDATARAAGLNLRRVDIEVRSEKDDASATAVLSGFVGS